MNIVLFNKEEVVTEDNQRTLCISSNDRRAMHITQVLKAKVDDPIKLGERGNPNGKQIGKIIAINSLDHQLEIALSEQSTPTLRKPKLGLISALPRPKAARRMVRNAAELGFSALHFIHSYKVEKSYWQSPLLGTKKMSEQIDLGLEQAGDTIAPHIQFHQRFKPFVEDELTNIVDGQPCYLLHPRSKQNLTPTTFGMSYTENHDDFFWFIIGPESGFIDYEVELFKSYGVKPVCLGDRIFRTENMPTFIAGIFNTRF